MSLVAYAASSDEDSEYEDESEKAIIKSNGVPPGNVDNISDDDDENYTAVSPTKPTTTGTLKLDLPKPKQTNNSLEENYKTTNEELEEIVTPAFAKLPTPKAVSRNEIIEEDDEFLHKKAIVVDEIEKPKKPIPIAKGPVKIAIPSLKDFKDVDDEIGNKKKNSLTAVQKPKGCGLLSILPQAKSERNFAKPSTEPSSSSAAETSTKPISVPTPAFIPDTVRNRRAAHNTEGVDGVKIVKKPKKPEVKKKVALVDFSDSEESDADETASGDFFSLNNQDALPEVSANEINALVAKRAAKIAETSSKYLSELAAKQKMEVEETPRHNEEELGLARKRYYEEQLDTDAVQALVGSSAKRLKKQQQEIQVVNLSSSEVLPSREEWMRTALASSTEYQPTGVLTDEEPVAGTRRKHQITYLAHKAKSNEAELQAMWAANRQTRRATQSKYGF